MASAVVAIHSFTPVFLGRARPWEIGILFDDDRRLAEPILDALAGDPTLTVGVNQPYAPADGVYYTLARHARARGLPAVMIEFRNDAIADAAGQAAWAQRLGAILASLSPTIREGAHATA
jgi:predicted N-formylglutamate amidohydrolase